MTIFGTSVAVLYDTRERTNKVNLFQNINIINIELRMFYNICMFWYLADIRLLLDNNDFCLIHQATNTISY